jgi:hypothetical protein
MHTLRKALVHDLNLILGAKGINPILQCAICKNYTCSIIPISRCQYWEYRGKVKQNELIK